MTPPARSDLSLAFEAHAIDSGCFSHAEHVQVAYELLRSYDFIDATAIYAKGIRAIAAKAGADQKFNVTITYAFLGLIAERMLAAPTTDFAEFAKQNPVLFSKDILAKWYDADRLQSEAARLAFVMPEPARG